jgi:hypothetical protein
MLPRQTTASSRTLRTENNPSSFTRTVIGRPRRSIARIWISVSLRVTPNAEDRVELLPRGASEHIFMLCRSNNVAAAPITAKQRATSGRRDPQVLLIDASWVHAERNGSVRKATCTHASPLPDR